MKPWQDVAGESFLPAEVLLDQAEMAVIVTDRRCHLLYINAYAARLLSVPGDAARFIGQSVLSIGFAAGDQDKLTGLARCVLHGRPWEGTFASAANGGSSMLVRAYAVPLRHSSGAIDGISIFAREAGQSTLAERNRIGLLERIDDSVVHRTGCIPQAQNDYAIGGSVYSGGIGFTTARFGDHVPMTWPEFWDAKGFPGRRGLRTRITDTLEIALMGDGVPASEVYPCDIERAFRALDRIKPAVNHWIAQTEQTVSLIQQNETDFTFTYTTRVKNMQAAGVPIGYSFKQNLLGIDMRWQWQLHQDAVNLVAPVQIGNQRQQLFGGSVLGRSVLFAVEADLLRALHLTANVDFRRRVVPHQHHRQPRSHPSRCQRLRLGSDLRADFTRYLRTIKNPGCHRTSLRIEN